MNRSKIFVVFQMLILLAGFGSPLVEGQKAGPNGGSPAVEVSLAVKQGSIVVGDKEVAVITVKNISSQDVSFPTDRDNYRVHVNGEKGEPPLTVRHRHQRGTYLPGDPGDLLGGGVIVDLAPGVSQSKEFNLAEYYSLDTPGKYRIYMEYRDESGKWLRTNTVQFEIQAAAQ